jgi:WhiB family redox-sensing transcriptional regulator
VNSEPVFNTNDALIPSAQNWSWQDKALCKTNGVDVTVFFNDDMLRGPEKQARESAAKKICTACPIKTECLEHALTVPENFGVWGGLTEEERMVIVKFKRSIDRAEKAGIKADATSWVHSVQSESDTETITTTV